MSAMDDMTTVQDAHAVRIDHDALNALFRRVQANDHAAFKQLYDILGRKLLAYCLSFTNDSDIAHDLLQATMVSVYEHRSTFKSGNLVGWIFTIARNACRNWEVASKRFEPIDESYEALDEEEVRSEKADNVFDAVLALPFEYRQTVLLHYYGGMSVKEIGTQEDISISLVKVRLFRARKLLAEILQITLAVHHEID